MKLVRRARKSIRERRMKACLKDLNANLEKVEMRVFRQYKQRKQQKAKACGERFTVPKDVLRGMMSPELYRIECRLHQEASLPPPPLYEGHTGATRGRCPLRWIGFVDFDTITKMAQLGMFRNTLV